MGDRGYGVDRLYPGCTAPDGDATDCVVRTPVYPYFLPLFVGVEITVDPPIDAAHFAASGRLRIDRKCICEASTVY